MMDTNVSIVNMFLEFFVSIAERLKEERVRLGLSQADFAELGGAHRKSQGNYESGERSPDANYLAAIGVAGADVQYIVTGVRRGDGLGLSAIQQAVLTAVDLLSLEKKVDAAQLAAAVVKLLASEVRPAAPSAPPAERYEGSKQIFNASVEKVAGRDVVENGRKRKE